MKKPKIAITVALKTEPFAIDHIGVKQGLDQLKDKIDYKVIDPIYHGFGDTKKLIVEYKPDMVIHYMDNSLTNELPERIHNSLPSTIQVFWEMDYRPIAHNIEQSYDGQWMKWRSQARFLDHIFLSNKGQIGEWERWFKVPVTFLPHGCYVLDKLQYDKKFKYPCVFIGGNSDGMFITRKKLIDKIKELTYIEHLNSAERKERNRIWEDMPKIYHSSDTVLDISHFWHDPGYASGRYFYIAGLGGCSITKRFPGCEELYPEGTKIYFDTPEEAVEKIKYYQKNEKEREKVKLAAFKYNKKHHNFRLRFNTIFKTLNIKL